MNMTYWQWRQYIESKVTMGEYVIGMAVFIVMFIVVVWWRSKK